MVELGELEKHHKEFGDRNVRIISVSPDNLEDSKKTQDAFPHLQVVSDAELNMADALAVRDKKNKGEHGQETNSPTTILVDKTGTLKFKRPPSARQNNWRRGVAFSGNNASLTTAISLLAEGVQLSCWASS